MKALETPYADEVVAALLVVIGSLLAPERGKAKTRAFGLATEEAGRL